MFDFLTMPFLYSLFLGCLLGALIAWAAWRFGTLSPSGAWAAAFIGGVIFGLGGLPWASLLLIFFISSSALSRLFARRKATLADKFSKGSRRDWAQVLANGGLGVLLALMQVLLPGQDWPWLAYAGAIAAVNADTWATELGVLSPTPPRLITSGQRVERGTSGAVSVLGMLAGLGGAILVGLAAVLLSPKTSSLSLLAAILLGGLCGAMVDSAFGATVQAVYWCPACSKETERHPRHGCGNETVRRRGWRWINNDVVNFLCALTGGVVTIALH